MKRRFFALVCAFIMAFSVLAGCSSTEGSKSKGGVTVTYWHTLTEQKRVQQLKSMIEKFEKQNDGIKVEQVAVPESDFPTKISASLGAGKMPTLIQTGINQTLFLASQNVLDTKSHEEIVNKIGKDDFFSGALNTMKVPDKEGYYGVPLMGWVQGVWYRKDLFKEKGLEPPTTWENILAAAKAFNDPDNKKYGIVVGTAKDNFAEQTFSQFALSNQARVFDKEGNVNFNTPEMVESLDYYKKLSQYTPSGAEGWRQARDLYLSERAPMVMYSSYLMSDLVDKDLADVTGFSIPEKKEKAAFGQITSLSVTKTSSKEQKKAAKKFISFLMKKENYIDFMHMSPGGHLPTRQSIAEAPEYLQNKVLKAFGEEASVIASGLNNFKRFGLRQGVINPAMGDVSAKFIIGEGIYNSTIQDKKPGQAAKNIQEKIEQTVQ